jgi:hypothetical protein
MAGMKKSISVFLILSFIALFAGCAGNGMGGGDDLPEKPPPDTTPAGIKALRTSLDGVGSGEAAYPGTIVLASTLRIPEDWGAANTEIKAAKKYLILDMTACTVANGVIPANKGGTDAFGHPTPNPNDMSIIHNNEYIKGLVLPSGATEIGAFAFYKCENITSLVIPDGVITIRNLAFNGLHITRITIPASVTSIGDMAFDTTPLNEVVFEGAGVLLENYSFMGNDFKTQYDANGAGVYAYTSVNNAWTYSGNS